MSAYRVTAKSGGVVIVNAASKLRAESDGAMFLGVSVLDIKSVTEEPDRTMATEGWLSN